MILAFWIVGPVLPLAMAFVRPRVWPGLVHGLLWGLFGLLWLWLFVGAAFSAPGDLHATLLGTGVLCALFGGLRLAAGRGLVLTSAALLIAVWSLLGGVLAVLQAQRIADGQPYCIQRHTAPPVTALADLRLLSFFNTSGGWRNPRDLFHGFLEVGDRIYNWHSSAMRFEERSEADMWFTPRQPYRGLCEQRPDFVTHLPIW